MRKGQIKYNTKLVDRIKTKRGVFITKS